jgi:hypothetical protein
MQINAKCLSLYEYYPSRGLTRLRKLKSVVNFPDRDQDLCACEMPPMQLSFGALDRSDVICENGKKIILSLYVEQPEQKKN